LLSPQQIKTSGWSSNCCAKTQAMESSHNRVGSEVSGFASRLQETIDTNELGRMRTASPSNVPS
jgi:hypothetical protein